MNKLISREKYHNKLKNSPVEHCALCDLKNDPLVIKHNNLWSLVLAKSPYWRYHVMLVPHRHFENFTDINKQECREFNTFYDFILEKFKSAKITHEDGSEITQFLCFWRLRNEKYDFTANVGKLKHFHCHIVPEKEYTIDKAIDKNAHKTDIELIKSIFA